MSNTPQQTPPPIRGGDLPLKTPLVEADEFILIEAGTGRVLNGSLADLKAFVGAGAEWHITNAPPTAALGVNGDNHLEAPTGNISRKTNGAWTFVGSIKGPKGESIKGDPGVGVPTGGGPNDYLGHDGIAPVWKRGVPTTGSGGGTTAPASSGFVQRDGTQFRVNGQSWRGIGVNFANGAGGIANCGPVWTDAQKDEELRKIAVDAKANLVRVWVLQPYAPTDANGVTNFQALDRLVELAKKHNLKLLLTFEDHWGHCFRAAGTGDTENVKSPQWYQSGYLSPYLGYRLSYKSYVQRVVERYKNEAAIMAWELMNEATPRDAQNAFAFAPLLSFTQDMVAAIKAIDSNHLVTLGMGGTDEPDSQEYWRQIHQVCDFADYHFYDDHNIPWPGSDTPSVVPINLSAYTQDFGWNYTSADYGQGAAQAWDDKTITIPAGSVPFHRAGVAWDGTWAGDVYVDTITITQANGTVVRTWDWADGTTSGVIVDGRAGNLANVAAPASLGLAAGRRVLKLTLAPPVAGGPTTANVSLPDGATEVQSGRIMTWRVWHDGVGNRVTQTSPAARTDTAHALGFPLGIGENGMWISGPRQAGEDPNETPQSRATKMQARMQAAFSNGVAFFLVWIWEPLGTGEHSVNTGDPLVPILAAQAQALRDAGYNQPGSGGNTGGSNTLLVANSPSELPSNAPEGSTAWVRRTNGQNHAPGPYVMSGYWKHANEGRFYLPYCGVIADGTDTHASTNTTIVQNLINDCGTIPVPNEKLQDANGGFYAGGDAPGGGLIVPEHNAVTTLGPLQLTRRLAIEGKGRNTVVRRWGGSDDGPMFRPKLTSTMWGQYVRLEKFMFDGNDANVLSGLIDDGNTVIPEVDPNTPQAWNSATTFILALGETEYIYNRTNAQDYDLGWEILDVEWRHLSAHGIHTWGSGKNKIRAPIGLRARGHHLILGQDTGVSAPDFGWSGLSAVYVAQNSSTISDWPKFWYVGQYVPGGTRRQVPGIYVHYNVSNGSIIGARVQDCGANAIYLNACKNFEVLGLQADRNNTNGTGGVNADHAAVHMNSTYNVRVGGTVMNDYRPVGNPTGPTKTALVMEGNCRENNVDLNAGGGEWGVEREMSPTTQAFLNNNPGYGNHVRVILKQ